jgi:F-type H+-transporting ATPase subunit b
MTDYTVVYQIIFFLILWAILSKVLFRPYLALLDERERKTAGALREAADLEREGERLRAEYEEKIAQAQAAGYAAREVIVKEAREQREKLLAQARQESASVLEKVRQEVRTQMEKERQLAVAEAANIARDMVSKILGRNVA